MRKMTPGSNLSTTLTRRRIDDQVTALEDIVTTTTGPVPRRPARFRRRLTTRSIICVVASMVATVPSATAAFAAQTSAVRCGATITSDVTLTKDLRSGGDGLVIGRDYIRIDLGGHTMYGSTGGGIAIQLQDRRGVRVTHGSIRRFDQGININGGSANRVSRVWLSQQSGLGLLVANTSHTRVVHNHLSDIGDGHGTGIQLYRADYNQVRGNSVRGAGDGISLDVSSHNRVESNRSSHNGAGIGLFDASLRNLIRSNRTDFNEDTGVLLDGGDDHNVLSHNSASGNGFAGIGVGNSNHVRVSRNHTNNNPGSGIAVGDADGTLVVGNVANHNGFSPYGCTPECPLLNDGINVTDTAAGTTLTRNKANYNSDLGIDAPTGVTDGGHNSARHNGNPEECRPVNCRPHHAD